MWHTEVKRNKVGNSVFNKLFEELDECELVRKSKHTAAIVHKGKIISIGKCQKKTHPIMLSYQAKEECIYLHAEIDAIVKAINLHGNKFLKECDLYVMRVGKNGIISNSKPCTGCQKAIDAFQLKNVYWTM